MCLTRGRNICLHFPEFEPLSPSSFSSHGRHQPVREISKKKKDIDQEGMGEERKSDLIRCRTAHLCLVAVDLSSLMDITVHPLSHSPLCLKYHLLWVHVGPSQPSLQTQVNDSPVTTQVPPFSHGFGRQLEFLAGRKENIKQMFSFVQELRSS